MGKACFFGQTEEGFTEFGKMGFKMDWGSTSFQTANKKLANGSRAGGLDGWKAMNFSSKR